MQVKEVMSRRIIAISPEETVAVAARLLSQHNIGALPVCSRDGRLRGMVTGPGYRRALRGGRGRPRAHTRCGDHDAARSGGGAGPERR